MKRDKLIGFLPEFRRLYVQEKLSPVEIARKFSTPELYVTKHDVIKYLREENLLRTVKEASIVGKRGSRFQKIIEMECSLCNEQFLRNNNRQRYCRKCVPNKVAADRLRFYGISQRDYDRMIIEQNNSCAICKVDFLSLKNHQIHIDHCHDTGITRGILCGRCNYGMVFVDLDGWISSASEYKSRTLKGIAKD